MQRVLSQLLRSEDGTAAVEFAFVAPATIALIFGIIEGGRLYFTRGTMQYATEEASRYIMVHTNASNETLTTYAKEKLIGIDPNGVNVTLTDQTISSKTFKTITMTTSFSSVVGSIIPWHNIPVTATTTVPVL